MIDYQKLSLMQLDALREAGNIGSGHAATALSQLIKKTISISVTNIEVVEVEKITSHLGGPEQDIMVVYIRILGDVTGGILLTMLLKDALALADMLRGEEMRPLVKTLDIDRVTIKESGTLVIASYLRALGKFLDLSIIPAAPNLASDKMGKILKTIIHDLAKDARVAFCIETIFAESSNQIKGHFLLVLEEKCLKLMLEKLGV